MVGAMSCKRAIGAQGEAARVSLEVRRRTACSVATMNGTGLVVCAVCGPPVSGSIICSALPWSAVMIMAPAMLTQRRVDLPEAGVNRFDGSDGWRNLPGMSHHVGVGEVHHHHIEGVVRDRLLHRVSDSLRRHLRLQVVGRDFRRLAPSRGPRRGRAVSMPPLKK